MRSWKRVLVCGLGASGRAAVRLLVREGVDVLAVDERDGLDQQAARLELQAANCPVVLGVKHPPPGAFDAAVTSPGLSIGGPFLSEVRQRGIPVVSEVEVGWSRFGGRTIAVTGSNGKSSVVKALAECLRASGRTAVPCGNYGRPVCDVVWNEPQPDWLVIEVSSFQLETCIEFRPDMAVLLNLQPNHLDRHGSMEEYERLKVRIFAQQRGTDVAVIPADWMARHQGSVVGGGRWVTFGADLQADYRYEPGFLRERGGGAIEIAGSSFDNPVLGPNAAALYGAARSAGIDADWIRNALVNFEPLPHRAQGVGVWNGVTYVDDSKATNLAAMMASIRMQSKPVWLIAGGRPKESCFQAARGRLREQVRGVFLIGEAAAAMAAEWGDVVSCEECGTLECAVAAARRAARPGEVVLLAPACTAFDQFPSYAARGDRFQNILVEKD